MPVDTFVLTTYSFSMGIGDPWREESNKARLAAVTAEVEELAIYLLENYAGSGKTFVLQNWEGDWALLGSYDLDTKIPEGRAERMAAWFNARQRGVANARRRIKHDGVRVVHAIEVNRVLDDTSIARRVVSDVLPISCADAVSYSAWEALQVAPISTQSMMAAMHERLERAVNTIRNQVSEGVPVYVGEFGFAENLLPENIDTGSLVESVTDSLRDLGVGPAVYWQIFDNECDGLDCMGLWVSRPDGSRSAAGDMLATLASR